MIGIFDVGVLLLDTLLAVLSTMTGRYSDFCLLPVDSNLIWVIVVKILLVDLTRVFAFGLLIKRDFEKRSRLLSGLSRVATMAIYIFLLTDTMIIMGTKGHIFLLILNVSLLILDLYFSAVIFSHYRTSTQEEIEIELKRLGGQQMDVYKLEEL